MLPDACNCTSRAIEWIARSFGLLTLIEEDIRFHNLIAAATGNHELCRILENIDQKSVLCRMKTHSLPAASSPDYHDRIYRALKDGDRVRAQAAMRDHILHFRDSFLRSMHAEESDPSNEEEAYLVAQGQKERLSF